MTFRSKTRKRLDDTQLSILEKVIIAIIAESEYKVEELLWKITYLTRETMESLGFAPDFDSEIVVTIRGEIVNQYRIAHPNWEYTKKFNQEPYNTELSDLRKAVSDDVILYEIMQKIFYCISYEGEGTVKRAIYLLDGTTDEYCFGGLRQMGFTPEEADFLKPYSIEIAKAFTKAFQKQIPNIYELSIEKPNTVVREERSMTPQVKAEELKKDTDEGVTLSLIRKQDLVKDIFRKVDKLDEEYDRLDEQIAKEFTGTDLDWLLDHRDDVEKLFQVSDKLMT